MTDSLATVRDCRLTDLPRILDARGSLTFVEGRRHVPFDIERVYWIYDVPGGQVRGGHAYRTLHEFFVSISGSFDVVVDDASEARTFMLNRSYRGLYVPPMIWRQLLNFSTNSVCLILASDHYREEDYLRGYPSFREVRGVAP